jgi:hypothetical protein
MPKSRLHQTVAAYFRGREIRKIPNGSPEANNLKQRVGEAYDVSAEAGGVRLSQLGYLTA